MYTFQNSQRSLSAVSVRMGAGSSAALWQPLGATPQKQPDSSFHSSLPLSRAIQLGVGPREPLPCPHKLLPLGNLVSYLGPENADTEDLCFILGIPILFFMLLPLFCTRSVM